MEIAQTSYGWQTSSLKVLLGKVAAITLALTLHGSLLLPLLIKPDYTPPAPISTASFEFVNLPTEINSEQTEINKAIEPVIEQVITQPEVITPPAVIQEPTPQAVDEIAIPAIKKLVKAQPTPKSQPRRKTAKPKPAKIIAPQKNVIPKPIVEKPVEPTKTTPIVNKQEENFASRKKTFTPPVGRVSMLNNPKPVYPIFARRRGFEGLVLLSVDVNSEGYPLGVKIKKGSLIPRVDKALGE
jgi:periplasmic protein TonB